LPMICRLFVFMRRDCRSESMTLYMVGRLRLCLAGWCALWLAASFAHAGLISMGRPPPLRETRGWISFVGTSVVDPSNTQRSVMPLSFRGYLGAFFKKHGSPGASWASGQLWVS
jgi:hypothetical protein